MTEINITRTLARFDMRDYASSIVEMGQNAGRITWANALQDGGAVRWKPPSLSVVKDFLRGFGAWDEYDLRTMKPREYKALLLQFIAGDWREAFGDNQDPGEAEWSDYQSRAEAGKCNSSFHRDSKGQIYFGFE